MEGRPSYKNSEENKTLLTQKFMLFSFLFLPICLSVSVFSFFNMYIFLYFFSLSVSISISHTYIFFLYCSTLYKTQSEFAYGFFCAVRALARTRARTNARAQTSMIPLRKAWLASSGRSF